MVKEVMDLVVLLEQLDRADLVVPMDQLIVVMVETMAAVVAD